MCDDVELDWGTDPVTPDAWLGEPLQGEPTGTASMLGKAMPMAAASLVLFAIGAAAFVVWRRRT